MSNRMKLTIMGVYIVLFALIGLISYRAGKRGADKWWEKRFLNGPTFVLNTNSVVYPRNLVPFPETIACINDPTRAGITIQYPERKP